MTGRLAQLPASPAPAAAAAASVLSRTVALPFVHSFQTFPLLHSTFIQLSLQALQAIARG